jgi:hypothetical protein
VPLQDGQFKQPTRQSPGHQIKTWTPTKKQSLQPADAASADPLRAIDALNGLAGFSSALQTPRNSIP